MSPPEGRRYPELRGTLYFGCYFRRLAPKDKPMTQAEYLQRRHGKAYKLGFYTMFCDHWELKWAKLEVLGASPPRRLAKSWAIVTSSSWLRHPSCLYRLSPYLSDALLNSCHHCEDLKWKEALSRHPQPNDGWCHDPVGNTRFSPATHGECTMK